MTYTRVTAALSGMKRVSLSGNTSGNNTLIAAVPNQKIVVVSLFLVAAGAVTVAFQSGAGGTALTGVMSLPANGILILPFNEVGWFETVAGQLLNMSLGSGVQASGSLAYVTI